MFNRANQDDEVRLRIARSETGDIGSRNPYARSWALIVGINAYKFEERLNFAVADAKAVAALLPSLGFPSETTRILLDTEATKERIERVLYQEFAGIDRRIDCSSTSPAMVRRPRFEAARRAICSQ